MRTTVILALALSGMGSQAVAQISVGIDLPSVSIGVNLGGYPDMTEVPGYPVYYAPQLGYNLFFYDGLYWVYSGDGWYSSAWYNGPWDGVAPQYVPLFVLRVPVRYYREPPAYFGGWSRDESPHWGEHWGRDWERQRSGWDQWDRRSAPRAAPLPTYQRQYSGSRYPDAQQQRSLHEQNYHFQSRDSGVSHQVEQQHARQPVQAPQQRGQQQQQQREQAQQRAQQDQKAQADQRGQQQQQQREQPPQRGPQQQQREQPQQRAQQEQPPRQEPRDQPREGQQDRGR